MFFSVKFSLEVFLISAFCVVILSILSYILWRRVDKLKQYENIKQQQTIDLLLLELEILEKEEQTLLKQISNKKKYNVRKMEETIMQVNNDIKRYYNEEISKIQFRKTDIQEIYAKISQMVDDYAISG